jgi:ferredoxin
VRIGQLGEGAVTVCFAKCGVTAQWSRDSGTLLELAEAFGLAPVFGCRSGICGTCATRSTSGAAAGAARRMPGAAVLLDPRHRGIGRHQSRPRPRPVGR